MKYIQNFIPPIISITIFVVVSLLMSTVPSLNFQVDAYFWTQIIGSTLALLLTYAVWCPTGEDKAKREKKVIVNSKVYNARANFIVEKQLFKSLAEFCEYKNKQKEKEIITEKLGKHMIEYEVFELAMNKERTDDEDSRLSYIMVYLSDAQKRVLKRLCEHGVRFEKLKPKHITIGDVKVSSLVNKNHEKSYKTSRIMFKSIWGIFTTCFTYFVLIEPNDQFGIPQIVMIFMWFFTFLMAIYSAIQTGYKSIAVYRDRYNLEQAELCAEFFDFAKVSEADISALNMKINKSIEKEDEKH